MRIAICDDEEQYRAELRACLNRIAGQYDNVIDSFCDGNALIREFSREAYDLVFLDIEMPEADGITVAKRLRTISDKVYIVFLTGHVEYALEGYEVNALRYLTKPVQSDKVREVLSYINGKTSEKKQLIVKEDGEELLIDLADILYFEAQNQNVRIRTVKGEHIVRYNISDFEERLRNNGFFRTHRGYLVSLAKVKKLVKNDVILEDDSAIPVSRSNVKALKDALYAYVEEQAI